MSKISTGLLFLGRRPAHRFVEIARRCESLGFRDFWIPDERFFREVYSLCTLVAASTERIRVGPCVTDPYTRHPALTAMAIATLDEISNGRALFGIGAGISGFSELGLSRDRPARAVQESIELVRRLLTGQYVEFTGETVRFAGSLDFEPQQTEVPVYVAAAGPRMLHTAGRLADGVIIEGCVGPGSIERSMAHIRKGLECAGRTPDEIDLVARIDIAVDEDLDCAYDVLRPRLARSLAGSAPEFARFVSRGLTIPDHLGRLAGTIGYTHDPARLRPLSEQLPRDLIDEFMIAATPDSIEDRLDDIVNQGATQIMVNPIPTEEDRVEPVLDAVSAWALGRS